MIDLIINEQLVEVDIEVGSQEEVIRNLSGKLDKCGYVENGFAEAVLAREKQYPTGLPTKIPVALCHVEAEYVKQTAMAVATLKHPVEFHDMGNPENVLNVEIVFLLTILDPKKQVFYLRKMMDLFKDETLPGLKNAKTKQEVVSLLGEKFNKMEER
ncbi:PTS sugar transporter subunit IIA [Pelolinea submarina]|jgi:PTS system galactitol-specific IIA component|uniref:PTS system IIA component (Gat family) n=1 Tax=Pelolinea submarina TaxID=913107 RepID=A0A347ZQE2_9CHLR|nr:PTS sugar transporter subunit IIA [Pelolinea submarina]REG06147.1 PTS system IIA component (Gat family) [Pelolinea submarina]BBB47523.1 PTS system, galactitol-specific IIA component [Pelolinea submarina]